MKIFFLVFGILAIFFTAPAQQQKYSKLKIATGSDGLMQLAVLGIPVDEGMYKKGEYFIGELSENDILKLDENGFIYDILVDDMSAFYSDRNLYPEKHSVPVKSSGCGSTAVIQTPSHFVLGSVGGFYTLAELYAQLDSMRVNFPNLLSVKQQIGTINSIEGRPTYYIRISDNPDVDESEPEVMYTGLTHAREPMGMQQLVFFMWYLLENYNTNNEIHQLLDNTELYFIPCNNPDGYNYNCVSEPSGGGMWRKNRRNNGSGDYGVDLNRNYGYEWGYDDYGSSDDPADDAYRGTTGFSEPETQTMKWFCEYRNIVLAIDYHCYSNLLIYPWSYIAGAETPDSLIYHAYSKLMTEVNAYAYGTPDQTVGYVANGVSLDWYYGEQGTKNKIIGFSPEAGDASDGFWPASNRIEVIAKVNVEQNMYIVRFAGKYAKANDLTPYIVSQPNGYLKFDIQRLGLASPATFTVSLQPLTSNISSVGGSKVYSSLTLLQQVTDSISYSLSGGIQSGDVIKYLLCVNNGLYTVSDTITKIYGTPFIAFNDNCSSITNWTAGGWGICTSQYYSATSSIADSPTGNYSDNANKSVTLNAAVDLTNCAAAILNFWTKWDIEAGYDYVQVKASTDGGTSWTPLCGKYTKPGSLYQIQDSPLYDGSQSSWVQEEINLSDYLGQSIKLRFTLVSDGYSTGDGFFFDDITVTKINNPYTGIIDAEGNNNVYVSEPYPNPTGNNFSVSYTLYDRNQNTLLKIYDALGRIVSVIQLTEVKDSLLLNVSEFESGIYFYQITSNEFFSEIKKLIIIK
ncbi:MAG: M14 family zinc carboxypeptidase [Bacteroidota bacterium]